MESPIHIVEPTLESEAGHCGSFVASLCRARAGSGPDLCVWAGRRARLGGIAAPGVAVRPHFFRRARRVQEYLLLSKLLRSPGRVFIPTAGRADLVLLDLAARGEVPAGKVFLFFHWIRPGAGKEDSFRALAKRQPNLGVLAPTESVAEILRRCGFAAARVVPYPITPAVEAGASEPAAFRHILYAGAARQDKGFPAVVDLVARLAETGRDLPVVVQASADHYAKYDPRTKADVARLEGLRYPHLEVRRETLAPGEYAALFAGAVCLQPYARADFADRISGVTLDALSAGAPVVATSGTWIARVVERFGAGRAVDDLAPDPLLAAVEEVRADYGARATNAVRAGRALQEENSARHLFSILAEG